MSETIFIAGNFLDHAEFIHQQYKYVAVYHLKSDLFEQYLNYLHARETLSDCDNYYKLEQLIWYALIHAAIAGEI